MELVRHLLSNAPKEDVAICPICAREVEESERATADELFNITKAKENKRVHVKVAPLPY